MAITNSDFANHNFDEICVSMKKFHSYSIIYFVISLMRLLLLFCYISYEIILFSSLQLTPGGVFINKC